MKFTLLGRELEFSEGRKNYMKVLTDFRLMGEQAEREMKAEYKERFGTVFLNSTYCERFLNSFGEVDYLDKIVMRYVAKARQYLTKYGIYDLSDNDIWDDAIVDEDRSVSQLQYYFNEFIVDALYDYEEGTIDDDVFVSRIKSKFEGTVIYTHLYNDVMALCTYVLNYLNDNSIAPIDFVYQADADKARAIYQNLADSTITEEDEVKLLMEYVDNRDSGMSEKQADALLENRTRGIPAEEKERLAFSLIELDSSKKQYYDYIFENFPSAKYEIAAIANYLSIDMSYLIDKEIKAAINVKSVRTEEDALLLMEKLKEMMKNFHVTSSERVQELEVVIKKFDEEARTYDGVIYETREQKTQAEKDDAKLNELCGNIGTLDKEACGKLLTEITHLEFTKAIKSKYLQLLNKRINQIDNDYLNSLLKNLANSSKSECGELKKKIEEYDASSEVKKEYLDRIQKRINQIDNDYLNSLLENLANSSESECGELKKKIEEYDASSEVKKKYLDRVQKRVTDIWEAEDFEEFSNLYMNTDAYDSAAIGKSIEYIRQKGRTESKAYFISALKMLNETEITAAAKYANGKEGGMLTSLINMGKKESYNTLTLNGSVIHPAITKMQAALKEKKGGGLFSVFKKPSAAPQTTSAGSFCTQCGAKVDGTSKFCPSCGNKLG